MPTELEEVLNRIVKSIKAIKGIIAKQEELEIIEIRKSPDARADHKDEVRLNILVRKIDDDN